MAKKSTERPRWSAHPDKLPERAHDLWPDISQWPTPDLLGDLRDAERNRPADYQSVVNGLHWYSTGDLGSAWSLLTAWLAVIAILLAAMTESLGNWALWTAIVFAAAFTFTLGRISSIAADHAERQRHSTVWLAAVEGTRLRPGRFQGWRLSPQAWRHGRGVR